MWLHHSHVRSSNKCSDPTQEIKNPFCAELYTPTTTATTKCCEKKLIYCSNTIKIYLVKNSEKSVKKNRNTDEEFWRPAKILPQKNRSGQAGQQQRKKKVKKKNMLFIRVTNISKLDMSIHG